MLPGGYMMGNEGGSGMSVPAVRRIVVGVDGSTDSVIALRWACREASIRDAEVHAVHVREAPMHSPASYAVLAPDDDYADDDTQMWQGVLPDPGAGVRVRTETAVGLVARVLLDRCKGADMLVLGTSGETPGGLGSAGPVIRACLRRAACPVVVISAALEGALGREAPAVAAAAPAEPATAPRARTGAGLPVPAGA
jgi:nucleotide-binding universal stress UspA family protein